MTRKVDERMPLHLSFEAACRALRHDARGIVGPTKHELRLELGDSAVARGVVLGLGVVNVGDDEARIAISWRAARRPHLFPVLEGELEVRREGWADVELRLVGTYRAPFWFAGELGDRVLGHHVADRAVRDFLNGVARRLVRSTGTQAKTGLHRTALMGGPTSEYRDERTR